MIKFIYILENNFKKMSTQNDDLLIISDENTIDFWAEFAISEDDNKKTESKVETESIILSEDDDLWFIIEEEKVEVKPEIVKAENSTKDSLNNLMWDLSSKPKAEDEILDFSITEEPKKVEETILTSNNENSLDLWGFDLFEDKKEETQVLVEEPKKVEETLSLWDNLSFTEESPKTEDLTQNLISENLVVPVMNSSNNSVNSQKEIGDMSDILERTISEFSEREKMITSEITEKEAHIKALESELNTEKEIMSDLNSEKSAIEKNRKSLEKMKNDFENREESKK